VEHTLNSRRPASTPPKTLVAPINWIWLRKATTAERLANADEQVFSDAATSTQAVGVYAPERMWAYWKWPDGADLPHINTLEFIGVLLGVLAILRLRSQEREGDPFHIHAHCDNTAAIAWTEHNRSEHAICRLLTLYFAMIQAKTRCMITYSHIDGSKNITADAISRDGKTSDPRDQNAVNKALQTTPRTEMPQALQNALTRVASKPKMPYSEVLREALILLEETTG
jgi:hypothetical protein